MLRTFLKVAFSAFKGGVANGKIAKNNLFCRFSKKWYYECLGEIIIPSEKKGRFVMKALSVSRLMLVLGLTLGIMILLAGVSPTVLNANSLTGGSWPSAGCNPCFEDSTEDCGDAQTGPGAPVGSLLCTPGSELIYCIGDENGDETCGGDGNVPCSSPIPESLCNSTQNGVCG